MTYCQKTLKFSAKPDYKFCRKLFENELNDLSDGSDFVFDWQIQKEKKVMERAK